MVIWGLTSHPSPSLFDDSEVEQVCDRCKTCQHILDENSPTLSDNEFTEKYGQGMTLSNKYLRVDFGL